MDVAALVTWVVTAGGGFVLLGTWLRRGGVRQQQEGRSRFPAPLIFGHFLLAATGLVLWIVYLVTDSDALAWVAFGLLVVVAALGFTMLARWIPGRRAAAGRGELPAEQHFPVSVVAAHGLVAAATLVLVLLAAAGVGD